MSNAEISNLIAETIQGQVPEKCPQRGPSSEIILDGQIVSATSYALVVNVKCNKAVPGNSTCLGCDLSYSIQVQKEYNSN